MILAVDVQYAGNRAMVAGVAFEHWQDQLPVKEYISVVDEVAEYQPGLFFKRELPCILHLLSEHRLKPQIIIVDGYVYLDNQSTAGLGKHLFDALHGEVAVIGVAKTPFRGMDKCHEVYRGNSIRPLYVTAAGVEIGQAQENIRNMHGKNRLPFLLKRVDQLSKGIEMEFRY